MNTRLSGTYNLQEKLVYTNNLCLQELFLIFCKFLRITQQYREVAPFK